MITNIKYWNLSVANELTQIVIGWFGQSELGSQVGKSSQVENVNVLRFNECKSASYHSGTCHFPLKLQPS